MTAELWILVFTLLLTPLAAAAAILVVVEWELLLERIWPTPPAPPLDLTDEIQARCHPRFCPLPQGILMPGGSVARPWEVPTCPTAS